MIRQLTNARRKRVLIDLNTQKDFFLAGGKVCVANHRRVLANIRRMMAWARRNNIPTISASEVHINKNGTSLENYCLDGTAGQEKIGYTLFSNRLSFPADGHADLPADVLRSHRQIILHKRCVDPFAEPRIDRLLSEMRANEFILVGAEIEGTVKAAALGLLQRSKNVTVVTDAVGTANRREAEIAMRKMQAKGAHLVETKKIAGTSHLRLVGTCSCQSCQGKTRKN